MIDQIVKILRQLPEGSQASILDMAQFELNRVKVKAQKRRRDFENRNRDIDPPMYRGNL